MPDGLVIAEPAPRSPGAQRLDRAGGGTTTSTTRPSGDPGTESTRRRWWSALEPWAAVAVTIVLVVPLLASALDQVGVDYRPGLDYAWIELRVHDVGGPENPLVGPYSRIGANHPGPLLFYLLALPYRLLGASSAALLSSAAVLNAVAVAGVAAVAYRRGRLPLVLLTSALTAVLLHALGTELFRDPWNPWMAVLPFLLFLLVAWSVATGDLPLLPLAAFVGSFLVQTHMGYAVLVAYLALWALAGMTLSTGRAWAASDRAGRRVIRRRLAIWTGVAVGVAAVCWVAPIVDQTTGDPGNITALFDSLKENENEPVGYDAAGGYVARELGTIGPWAGVATEADEADSVGRVRPTGLVPLLVPAVAFVAAVAVAAIRRRRDVLLLHGTVAVAVASGFLATAMIDGTVHTYLIRWMWPIAAVLWLSVGWAAYTALDPTWRRRSGLVVAPLLAVAVVGLTATTVRAEVEEPTPGAVWSDQILGVEDEVFDALIALGDPEPVFVFSGDGNLDSYAVSVGLQVQLEKHGIDIIDPTGDPVRYGDRRTDRDVLSEVNLLVVSEESIALLRQSPELDFVTSWNPRSPAQQAELTRLDRLAESDDLTPADAARRHELRQMGRRIGVFIDPSPRQG